MPEEGEKEVTKVKKTKSKKSEKDSGDAPARSPSKKRAQRSGSNVFAMFTQHQVAQFKEAFQFIDSDKDGIISKNDIRATFDALGRLCTDKELDEMASEAPGPINFTTFLTIFGDRAQGTDDEDVIANAFNMYDEGDGFCKEETLKHALCTWGEKFSQKECDEIFAEAPVDMAGKIDIKKFIQLITRGNEEEDEAAA
uniref:Myosin regulatory light chain 2 n=1 Tax=Aceria tosichella TaxID=561515 RepID=A0A6G1SBB9_9ACAR